MKAEEFRQYLGAQLNKVQQAYDEIAEAQREFQGAYVRLQSDRDRVLQRVVDTRGDSLPEPLSELVEQRIPTEREVVSQRLQELERLMAEKQTAADGKVTAMQRSAAELRQLNPQLNEREESLKARIASRQQKLHDLNAQVKQASGGLGFVFRLREIRELDAARHRLVGQLETLDGELAQVRQQWKEKREAVEAEQAQTRTEWVQVMVELSALRAERAALMADEEGWARRQAIAQVLTSLKSAPDTDGGLRRLAELNVQTEAYQAALGAVASMLGVLKGIHEGLERFGASVSALVEEQSRHSQYLSLLNIELPADVTAMDRNWDDLIGRVRDEKALVTHPGDFVDAMRPYVNERLTKERITGYFEALSQTTKQATAGWKG